MFGMIFQLYNNLSTLNYADTDMIVKNLILWGEYTFTSSSVFDFHYSMICFHAYLSYYSSKQECHTSCQCHRVS